MSEASLSAQIAELKEQVAYWRKLAGEPSDDVISKLADRGLTIRQAQIVGTLYGRVGGVSNEALMAIVWGDKFDIDQDRTLKSFLFQIRTKLGARSINTIWGFGLRLTDSGRATVNALLAGPAVERSHARHGREENMAQA